jgi:hypothetical protein
MNSGSIVQPTRERSLSWLADMRCRLQSRDLNWREGLRHYVEPSLRHPDCPQAFIGRGEGFLVLARCS